MEQLGNRIGGQVRPATGDTFKSVNPTRPAEVVATAPISGAAEVDEAVAAAAEAQREWALVPMPERAEVIAAAADGLNRHKAELSRLISVEVGKTLVEAGGDVQEAIDMGWFIAGQGRAPVGETVPVEMRDKMGWTQRHPVGVVGMITPWNFPIAIPSWKIFPALLAGNGVVIKPSEHAPLCCDRFVAALVDVGVPAGLLNVVHGMGEAGAAVATHPGVAAVSFTGSVPTGRKVAAAAMETGPRLVSLELGGKNAAVVMADADLDNVVDGLIFGAFGTSGQRCTTTSRLVIDRAVAGEVVERLAGAADGLKIGDPTEADTDVGPVITRGDAERIHGMVQKALDEGAAVARGGQILDVDGCEGGAFYDPTILTGVRADHMIALTEVFGPVLSVIEVDGFDEAIDVVNDTEYGLSAAIYTADMTKAFRAVQRIDTGIVYVNAPTIGAEIQLPFGGNRHTGNGYREAGTRGIEQFSQTKTVYVDYSGKLQRAQIDNRPSVAGNAV